MELREERLVVRELECRDEEKRLAELRRHLDDRELEERERQLESREHCHIDVEQAALEEARAAALQEQHLLAQQQHSSPRWDVPRDPLEQDLQEQRELTQRIKHGGQR